MSNIAGKAYAMNVITPSEPRNVALSDDPKLKWWDPRRLRFHSKATWINRGLFMLARGRPSTLTGLLGTVSGLIATFAAIGDPKISPGDRQKALTHGIAEAMYNTAYGLGLALLCMVAHLLLSTASKKVVADLEQFSLKLENMLGDGSESEKAAG